MTLRRSVRLPLPPRKPKPFRHGYDSIQGNWWHLTDAAESWRSPMFSREETDALARATVNQMALQVGDEMMTEVFVIHTIDTGGAAQEGSALSKAWRWAKGLVKGEAKVVVDFTYDAAKIGKQMGKRGWTDESIAQSLNNPTKTVATRDTRWLPKAEAPLDDPATAYYYKNGGYVVRNDRTGQITQISDRNDANWIAPWDK